MSARSVLIALALIPPNIFWVVMMERVDGRVFSTTASLFFTATFSLFLLTAANLLLRRLAPRLALRQGEMLAVFTLLSLATAMAGVDFGSPLMTLMAHAHRFATPENGWQQTILPHLPKWLIVQDQTALREYYLGNASLYTARALRAWVPPMACWAAFILLLLWVMACLNTLLRAQWAEKERLTYPIIQLPLAMTAEDGSLYRLPLFRLGFALTAALSLVNGLHALYPGVPSLTFNGFDAGQWFPSRPWNAVGWTPLAVFPFIVGLGYLLPVDLLFSCWFFFIFWRLEKVASSALGYMAEHPRFPYIDEQMFGGYMSVCAFALYSARSHLKSVWRQALSPQSAPRNPHEPMSFRAAVFGGIAGIILLLAFSRLAGLPVWLGILFFLIYFAIAVAVTRMRAELGPPTHDLHFIGPDQSITTVMGTRAIGGDALGVFTLYFWFNRAYRCHPMPHQLEGFRMAQRSGVSSRSLLPMMLLASLAGIVMVFWVTLDVSYRMGAAARIHGWSSLGFGGEAYSRMASWLASPLKPDPGAALAMGTGFLAASALTLIRMRIYGWPLHALGFSLSGGWSMNWVWLSLFVAWILKSLILRYSGLKGYRTGLPFFFGAILGDFLIGGLWTILALALNIPIYSLWSG
ncbi:MAG: hypothetical protein IT210_06495 [Armatimonadetes bacterium]|nr:hypothetical protein [Armatimonadota bacterium]